MDRDSKIQARRLFQRVFNTEDGRIVLTNILANLGYFDTDPTKINPDYIAFANRLLNQVGVNHRGNWGSMTNALMLTSGEADITEDR